MPEQPIILQLRQADHVRVRYGRANLRVARQGRLTTGELGTALEAFDRGDGGAEEVCRAFVGARIESHTPSFDLERADLGRLVALVATAAGEPKLQARTMDALAPELVGLAGAERERARRHRADLQKAIGSYLDSQAPDVVRPLQGTVSKLKFGLGYEPPPRVTDMLADSLAQIRTALSASARAPNSDLGLTHAKAPLWANSLKANGIAEQAALRIRESTTIRLEGHLASLGLASSGGPMSIKAALGIGEGLAPLWLGAVRSAESLAPNIHGRVAEIAANFSRPGLEGQVAALGITAKLGSLDFGASIAAAVMPKDFGLGALAESRLVLQEMPAWKDWADSFERALPANWRELDPAEVDRAAGLMADTGLCLAWVPRAGLIRALLVAPDHGARCVVLVAGAEEIFLDIEGALAEVVSEELAPIVGAADEAIRAARAGAPGPAQSHVASALGHVAHGYYGYDNFAPVRERFADVDPLNDVGFAQFSFYAIGRAWVVSIANFKQAGDGFNRNLTAHFVGAPHYSDANLLAGLMLLAGLLRELQRQELWAARRELQPA